MERNQRMPLHPVVLISDETYSCKTTALLCACMIIGGLTTWGLVKSRTNNVIDNYLTSFDPNLQEEMFGTLGLYFGMMMGAQLFILVRSFYQLHHWCHYKKLWQREEQDTCEMNGHNENNNLPEVPHKIYIFPHSVSKNAFNLTINTLATPPKYMAMACLPMLYRVACCLQHPNMDPNTARAGCWGIFLVLTLYSCVFELRKDFRATALTWQTYDMFCMVEPPNQSAEHSQVNNYLLGPQNVL